MSKKFNQKKYLDEKGNILLDKFADFLIEEHGMCYIDGQACVYEQEKGVYYRSDEWLEPMLECYFPKAKSHIRKEIMSKTLNRLKRFGESVETDDYKNFITLRNGTYNLDTKTLIPFNKDQYSKNKIEWDYNPNAYSRLVDVMFDKVSCFDIEVRMLLEEMFGYAMYKGLEFDSVFFLTGDKAKNGKSTITKILLYMLGRKNCSNSDLRKICDIKDTYTQAGLFGKLANVGDDISGEYIPDPSTMKTIASGDITEGRQIYCKSFEFFPYATMIFSAQHMPKLKDADNGTKRRVKIIPFDYEFGKDPEFDPQFERKIIKGTEECSADESMSYLINLGLKGLERLFKNGEFTSPIKVKEALKEYEKECNPILSWIEEYLEEHNSFCGLRRDIVYENYRTWCEHSGQKAMAQTSFVRFINDKYNLKVEPKYYSEVGKMVRTFVRKED